MFSDGLSEAQPRDGAQLGITRIPELVHTDRSKTDRDLVEVLFKAGRDYSRQLSQADDMTSVILKAAC